MKLGQQFKGRENNLGLLRFLAALMVILTHSYRLVEDKPDFLTTATNGQTTLGQLAVLMFFFYGGFLIMHSMMNKKTAKAFFRARCQRIFPPLWIVILVSVFILGPILSRFSAGTYFADGTTWKYLLNCILIPTHTLPGVFTDHYNTAVNGVLWTLPVEFICYILCFIFFKLGLTKGKRPLIILIPIATGAAAAWRILANNDALQCAVLPVLFFYLGMLSYLYRDQIPLNGAAAAGALAILVLASFAGIFTIAACAAYPYLLLYLGFGTRKKAARFGQKLELSYAMYLTGFPIQQTLIEIFPQMTATGNFLLAAALAICVSIPITTADKAISRRLNMAHK